MSFAGKQIVVTGGGSGMGRLACQLMAGQGAQVAALDINQPGLDETARAHATITTHRVDVTDFAAVRAVTDALPRIDRVYNAAAIMPLGKLLDQDNATIHRMMAINYGGLVNIAQAMLPRMIAQRSGDFISFSSMAGHIPILYVGGYNASKFAVSAFSEVLYHENRNSGVRFACVCPPPVATPLLQQGWDSVMPKSISEMEPLEPREVLETIEQALAKGEFWVFPGKGTRIACLMRRLMPGRIWNSVHDKEGF